jgi:hypothetical protein
MTHRLRYLVLAAVLLTLTLLLRPATTRANVAPCTPPSNQPTATCTGALQTPSLYIDFWGTEWNNTNNACPDCQTYMTYLSDFFSTVGGSRWLSAMTQYGAGNPSGLLAGSFIDSDPLREPTAQPFPEQVAAEARYGLQKLADYASVCRPSCSATGKYYVPKVVLVAVPPGHDEEGFGPNCTRAGCLTTPPSCQPKWVTDATGRSWKVPCPNDHCAAHGADWFVSGSADPGQFTFPYITLPYQLDLNVNITNPKNFACEENSVNPVNDGYGHGKFDGVSVEAGHEWAETITNPFSGTDQNNGSNWIDPSTNNEEVGDLCGTVPFSNVAGGPLQHFAVQPLWSNAANGGLGGCALGAAPKAQLTPAGALTFTPRPLNTTSAPQLVQLSNVGDADLHVGSMACCPGVQYPVPVYIDGPNASDFRIAPSPSAAPFCSHLTLPPQPGAPFSCAVGITFTPTAQGVRQATLRIWSDDPSAPATLALSGCSGLGCPVAASTFAASPSTYRFSPIPCLHCSPQPQAAVGEVAFTNVDTVAHVVQGVDFSGDPTTSLANPDYTVASDGCTGMTLQPNQACNISVRFAPSTTGERPALLRIADDAAGSPHAVPLSGTGTGPAVSVTLGSSPTPTGFVSFDSVIIGTVGAPQALTLTNSGQSPLVLQSIVASGPAGSADFRQTNSCPSTLAAGASCAIQVSFAPRFSVPEQGTLTLTDNASDSPQQLTLSGQGESPGQAAAQQKPPPPCRPTPCS